MTRHVGAGPCECGCGHLAPLWPATRHKLGVRKGEPKRFIAGHYRRVKTQPGYVHIGRVKAHIAIAERALGRPLPPGAQVHHVNGDKQDNRPGNLVVCQDAAYHALLHLRQRAKDGCGNPTWRRCHYCKGWDAPENLAHYRPGRGSVYHRACHAASKRRLAARALGEPGRAA